MTRSTLVTAACAAFLMMASCATALNTTNTTQNTTISNDHALCSESVNEFALVFANVSARCDLSEETLTCGADGPDLSSECAQVWYHNIPKLCTAAKAAKVYVNTTNHLGANSTNFSMISMCSAEEKQMITSYCSYITDAQTSLKSTCDARKAMQGAEQSGMSETMIEKCVGSSFQRAFSDVNSSPFLKDVSACGIAADIPVLCARCNKGLTVMKALVKSLVDTGCPEAFYSETLASFDQRAENCTEGSCALAGSDCDACTTRPDCTWTAIGCYESRNYDAKMKAFFEAGDNDGEVGDGSGDDSVSDEEGDYEEDDGDDDYFKRMLSCKWNAGQCFDFCKFAVPPNMANNPEALRLGAAEHYWTNEIHVVLPNMAEIWSNQLTESLNDEGSQGGEDGHDGDDGHDEIACPTEVTTALEALMQACPGTGEDIEEHIRAKLMACDETCTAASQPMRDACDEVSGGCGNCDTLNSIQEEVNSQSSCSGSTTGRRLLAGQACPVPEGEQYDHIRTMVAPPARKPNATAANATAGDPNTGFYQYIQVFQNSFSAGSLAEDESEDENQNADKNQNEDENQNEDDEDGDSPIDYYEGCFKPAFMAGVECPADCKVNFCTASPWTSQFSEFVGTCANQTLYDKCGCADATVESLAKLGTAGPSSFEAPPAPNMMAQFMSAGAKTEGGVNKATGSAVMVLFASIIEFNNTDGSKVYSPEKSTIVAEHSLTDRMTLTSAKYGPGYAQGLNSWGLFKMTSSLVDANGTLISNSLFDLTCAHANYNHTLKDDNRTYNVKGDESKCDVDFAGVPVEGNGTTHLAVKTATIGMQFEYSFDEDYEDGEGDEGSESFTVGGVVVEFAKKMTYGCGNTTCIAHVTASGLGAKGVDCAKTPELCSCGDIPWWTPAFAAVTERQMGFKNIQCSYFSLNTTANSAHHVWDPKVVINSDAAIKKSIAAQLPKKPVVTVVPPLQPGEVAPGVDQPKTGPRTMPVVKATAEIKVTVYNDAKKNEIKAAFAQSLGPKINASAITITKATFDIKSKVSFTKIASKADFEANYMSKFKDGLAADLKVTAADIDVVVSDAAARRHLLAGVDVDYTVKNLQTFDGADSISKVAGSSSALASVAAAMGEFPAVKEAPAVEANIEFEVETSEATVAEKVATDLKNPATITSVGIALGTVVSVDTSSINTAMPPPTPVTASSPPQTVTASPPPLPPPQPLSSPPPRPPPSPAPVNDSGGPRGGIFSVVVAMACVIAAMLLA